MIDYNKILSYWQQMSEEEKQKFIWFTYILCEDFGGDTSWCDFDGLLGDYERKAVTDELPDSILAVMKAEKEKREIEEEKLYILPGIVEIACEKTKEYLAEMFTNCHLSPTVRFQLLQEFKSKFEELIKIETNSWMNVRYHLDFYDDEEEDASTDVGVVLDGRHGTRYVCIVQFRVEYDEVHINVCNKNVIEHTTAAE